VDAFCVQYAPRAPGHAAVRDLMRLLYAVPSEGFEARRDWVERALRWLRDPLPARGLVDADEPEAPAATTRLALLVRVLEGEPASREALARLVRALVGQMEAMTLFAQVGLPAGQGFFAEASDRLVRRLLPSPPEHGKLSEFLLRLFPGGADADWLARLPPEPLARLFSLVGEARPPEPAPGVRLRAHLVDALSLLAVQTASAGLSEEVRERSPEVAFRASPFLRLRRVCDVVLARDAAADSLRELEETVADCRKVVGTATRHLEESGVSVDLVYRLERISLGLERMGAIGRVLGATPGEARAREAQALVVDLLRRAHADRSVRALVRRNARMLARKIIERTGHSGEHYITTSRAEFHGMVHSAAGGGLLTALAVGGKFALTALALAPFFTGLFVGLNYAVAFVLMQLLGFTLATKQPSVTAATLAGAISEGTEDGRLERLVELIPRLTRSQLAAALGNLSCVLPAGVAVAAGYHFITGHSFLSVEKAQAVVDTLHPWRSGTLPFAALTGLVLWVGSLAGGWLENFVVYRRLPEALAHHRLLRGLLGEAGARRLSEGFLHQVSGLGGSVVLGGLLALVPLVGSFFGVPADVRHVTFVFGSLAFAGHALGPEAVLQPDFLLALVGTVGTLACNFSVSFCLALAVALRARDVALSDVLRLVRAVAGRFLREPRSFFLPPRDATPEVAPAPSIPH
jgi:site-specific recombinase